MSYIKNIRLTENLCVIYQKHLSVVYAKFKKYETVFPKKNHWTDEYRYQLTKYKNNRKFQINKYINNTNY